jgi:hypothetical protein
MAAANNKTESTSSCGSLSSSYRLKPHHEDIRTAIALLAWLLVPYSAHSAAAGLPNSLAKWLSNTSSGGELKTCLRMRSIGRR